MTATHVRGRRRTLAAATLLIGTLLAGCDPDRSLDVTDPDVLNVADYNSPAGATPLRLGVIQDFAVAFSGTQDGVVVQSGNMADEIYSTDTFDDRLLPNARRTNENLPALDNLYRNLHRARSGASRTIPILREHAPTPRFHIGEMYAIRGFTEVFFAELYCSGVPFSEEDGITNRFGDPQTTTQILQRAVASFDSALAEADTSTRVQNMARIGRARALLDLNQPAQAAAAVQAVPTSFRFETFHSQATARQENGIWNALSVTSPRFSMYIEAEGTLQFLRTPADPRVPWRTTTRLGFNSLHRNLPDQLKYTRSGSVRVADGIEARLIELENRLRGGTQADRQAVFDGLNQLRASAFTSVIPPLTTVPTTQDAAVNMLFDERALWMWLTGHRLGDLRRLVRQYNRPASAVFPSGALRPPLSGTYGDDVNFVIPGDERNNPKFQGCIDRNP
jgi:hypothetical protein